MHFGSHHEQASELRVDKWIDDDGNVLKQQLRLSDLGIGYFSTDPQVAIRTGFRL